MVRRWISQRNASSDIFWLAIFLVFAGIRNVIADFFRDVRIGEVDRAQPPRTGLGRRIVTVVAVLVRWCALCKMRVQPGGWTVDISCVVRVGMSETRGERGERYEAD